MEGKAAENFLIQTIPHFRQTIILTEHSLAQIHPIFQHISHDSVQETRRRSGDIKELSDLSKKKLPESRL